jgi:hypothetical protein
MLMFMFIHAMLCRTYIPRDKKLRFLKTSASKVELSSCAGVSWQRPPIIYHALSRWFGLAPNEKLKITIQSSETLTTAVQPTQPRSGLVGVGIRQTQTGVGLSCPF